MHVEKNFSDSLIGTLLNIEGKTKDTLQSRLDLKDLQIREHLHPIEDGATIRIPLASFTLSPTEKEDFLKVLASVKVPDGYVSNITRCVQLCEHKINGLKSHDHHVIMQQLLPLAVRKLRNKELILVLIEVNSFFRELCSKVATQHDFECLHITLWLHSAILNAYSHLLCLIS